jgi:predicted thioesterase
LGAAHFKGAVGLRGQAELQVRYEHTAAFESRGDLPEVLSTPRLLGLVEQATHELAEKYLDAGWVSVGFQVMLEHVAPVEIGETVVAQALLESAEERDLLFRFTVQEKDLLRDVGRGQITRKIVHLQEFLHKLKKPPKI